MLHEAQIGDFTFKDMGKLRPLTFEALEQGKYFPQIVDTLFENPNLRNDFSDLVIHRTQRLLLQEFRVGDRRWRRYELPFKGMSELLAKSDDELRGMWKVGPAMFPVIKAALQPLKEVLGKSVKQQDRLSA